MDTRVFISKETVKHLNSNETMTHIMETPFKGIPETILEAPNEDAPSPNISIDVHEDFYSPLKDSMEVKTTESGNQNENETIFKDCFAQTMQVSLVDQEAQTESVALRRKLNLRNTSIDSISTPPCELRRQIYDLRDELVEAYDFHDNELKVLTEDISDDEKPELDDDVEHLRKSLADAERIYLDACNEISNLKSANLELNKKMEDETKNWLTCKHELEGQISHLNMEIKRKTNEIENLKKDKDDFDFRSQLQGEKFDKRIKELETALGNARYVETVESTPNIQPSKSVEAELQVMILSLQSELEESRKKIQSFEELENVLRKKEELIAYNENQINLVLLKNEELSSDIKKCKEEVIKNRASFEEIVKNLKAEWNNEVKVLKSEKDSLNDIIQQLSKENDEVNEALKENKMELNLKNEESRKSIMDLKREFEDLEKENERLIVELNEFKDKYEEELGKIELDYKVKLKKELDLMKVEKEELSEKKELSEKEELPEKEELSVKEEQDETIVKTEGLDLEEEREIKPFNFEAFVTEFTDNLIAREILSLEEVERSANVFYLLVDKYLDVLEKYENLKVEQEYKIKMEAYETCLEKLCSQLEASDSTLNASNNSFASFAADIRSSTMVQDEMEATVVNDRTLMTHDPLAITPFKTPRSILKSAKKPERPVLNESRVTFVEQDETLEEKFKLIKKFEARIEKLEDLASLFENEKERIRERFAKERENLKNSLASKSTEVDDLRAKLICEIICLNPELENNLASTSTEKILKILIQTIMDKCKNMQESAAETFVKEKFEWETKRKHFTSTIDNLQAEKKILAEEIEIYEGKIGKLTEELRELRDGNSNLAEKNLEIEERLSNQNEELRLLYSRVKEFEALEHNLTSANEIITSLRHEVFGAESLKSEITDLRLKIQEKDANLKNEIDEKEKILKDVEKSKDFFGKISKENEDLKKRIQNSEQMISELETDLALAKKCQTSNEARVNELISEIEILKKELSEGDSKTKALEEEIEEEKLRNENLESENVKKSKELENLEIQLKSEVEELNSQLEKAEAKYTDLQEVMKNLEEKFRESEQLKSAKNSEIQELKNLLEEKLGEKNEELKKFLDIKAEELEEVKRAKSELEVELRANLNSLTEAQLQNDVKIGELERAKSELEEELKGAQLNLNLNSEENKELKKSLEAKTGELEELTRVKNQLEDELRSAIENLNSLETAESKSEEIKNFLDLKTKELEELKSAKSELEQELKGARLDLNANSEASEELKKSLEAKKTELMELSRAKSELEVELADARMNLNANLEANEELKKTLESKTEELDGVKRLKIELEEELRGAKENLNSLAAAESKSEEIKRFLDAKTEELEELRRSKTELEEELKGARVDLNLNTEANEELKKSLEAKTGELEKLSRANTALEEELRGAKENLNSLAEIETRNEELKQFLEAKTEELEGLKRAKSQLEEELNGAKANLDSLAEAESKSEEFKKFLDLKIDELENLKRVKNELEEELRTALKNLDLNSEKYEELHKTLNVKTEELNEVKRSKVELEEELRGAQTNLNLNSEKTEELKKVLDVKSEELEEVNRVKNELEEELKNAKENLNTLAAAESKSEELKKCLALKAEELEKLKLAKNELEEELKGAKSNLTLNADKNEELKKFLDVKTEELEEITSAKNKLLEELKGAQTNLNQKLEELEETRRSKNSEIENLKIELKSNCQKYLELEESKKALTSELEEAKIRLKVHFEQTEELKKVKEDLQFSEEKISKLSIRIEELTSDNSQKIMKTVELEKCIEKYQNQLKEAEGAKENLAGILSDIRSSLDLKEEELTNGKSFTDKINDFKRVNGEIRGLFSLISESDKKSDSIQDSCKSITEEINDLRSMAISLQDELKKSEKKRLDSNSRKIGKLEELNYYLAELITEIAKSVQFPDPEKLNLASARNLKNVKKQIMDHFSNFLNRQSKEEFENLQKENSKLEKINKDYKDEINKLKMEIASLQTEFLTGSGSSQTAKRTGRKSDLCSRRMDKLEELNTLLAEMMTEIVTIAKIPNTEKLNLFSVRNITAARKQITDYIVNLVEGNTKELNAMKSQNQELDEECESYAKEIKALQQKIRATEREAMAVRETLETEVCKVKDEKHKLELEKKKLVEEVEKLKDGTSEGLPTNCQCSALQKELTKVKRNLYNKEQRILELGDLEVAITTSKSQIKYLEQALNDAKKKCSEEEEKNKKLREELKKQTDPAAATTSEKRKSSEDHELLEELRMRGSMTGGVVQEIVEKEKIRKLVKDNGILKDLCRSRYAEIKRLEAENSALKNSAPKNCNQMDSPIRTRCYNTRSRKLPDDPKSPWRFFKDKENQNL